jgi:hypothetical protein
VLFVDNHVLVAVFENDLQYLEYNLSNSFAELCTEINTEQNKLWNIYNYLSYNVTYKVKTI